MNNTLKNKEYKKNTIFFPLLYALKYKAKGIILLNCRENPSD